MNDPDEDLPSTLARKPQAIGVDDVRRIAALAHLTLEAEEAERYARELGAILGYVRQLEELDVTGVPPTAHVAIERLALREDEPGASLSRDDALREAPRVTADGFAVPAFVDEG